MTLLVETSIPVACAAVYGKTTAYGELATDTDMAGGGHQDHQPLLTGFEPDTEYHVMVQGVGPDGTLYICTAKDEAQVLGFRNTGGSGLPSIVGFVEDAHVTVGESLKYSVSFSNPARRLAIDFYVAVSFGDSLLFYPGWVTDWTYTRLTLDGGASGTVTLIDIPIVDGSLAGDYTFYAAPMVPGTLINFTDTSVVSVTIH